MPSADLTSTTSAARKHSDFATATVAAGGRPASAPREFGWRRRSAVAQAVSVM